MPNQAVSGNEDDAEIICTSDVDVSYSDVSSTVGFAAPMVS